MRLFPLLLLFFGAQLRSFVHLSGYPCGWDSGTVTSLSSGGSGEYNLTPQCRFAGALRVSGSGAEYPWPQRSCAAVLRHENPQPQCAERIPADVGRIPASDSAIDPPYGTVELRRVPGTHPALGTLPRSPLAALTERAAVMASFRIRILVAREFPSMQTQRRCRRLSPLCSTLSSARTWPHSDWHTCR